MRDRFLVGGLLLSFAGSPVGAQTTDVDALLKHEVGAQWGVEPHAVVLDLGRHAERVMASDTAEITWGTGDRLLLTIVQPDGVRRSVAARAGYRTQAPVAAVPLTAGDTLTEAAIAWTEVTRWGPPAVARRPEIGDRVVTRVAAGRELNADVVRPALLVRTGERITLTWEVSGVTLEMPAVALRGGQLQDAIRIRIETSGKRLEAVVTGRGTARIRDGGS